MIKSELLLACAALCIVFSLSAEAKLYKWVDEKGVTHYGETIPPEYANSEKMKLEKGQVEKLNKQRAEDKGAPVAISKTPDSQATIDAKRHDNALLNTYSNEKEIDLARDRNLTQVDARIGSYTTLLKSAQESLVQLQQESDARTKQNRKIPQSLADDLTETEARVAKLQRDLDTSQKESAAVKLRYEADKQRYRELKGLAAKTQPAAAAK